MKEEEEKPRPFTKQDILVDLEIDLLEEGVPPGHAYSLVMGHWRNKYLIVRR